jgi:cysteine desulfurase
MLLTALPPEGYLDASAGEPLHPAAREVLLAAADQAWADPQGVTPPARRARILLDGGIDTIAQALKVPSATVELVHGEATSIAINQLSAATGTLVISAIERDVVMRRALERDSRIVAVDEQGHLDLDLLRTIVSEIGPSALLSFQAANGEVGTIAPVAEISEIARSAGARLHLDYTGAIGRVPLVPADYISANASTWAGPKGIGLIIRDPRAPHSLIDEAKSHLSLPLALAAAAALEGRLADNGAEDDRLRELIDQTRAGIATIPDVDLVGDPVNRLPHVLTASFLYVDGQVLMDALAKIGLYIGSGSACVASRLEPSHVLAAMGRLSHGNIRLVLPHGTRASDIDRLLAALPDAVATIRRDSGITE